MRAIIRIVVTKFGGPSSLNLCLLRTHKDTDRLTDIQAYRQIDRHTDIQNDRQTDKQTDRWTDKQTVRQTDMAILTALMMLSKNI